MAIKLHNFKKALSTLDSAFIEFGQNSTSLLMRDGVIQRFEYTYELAWKLMKRYLEEEMGDVDVDALGKKELFRRAAEAKLIDDPETWFTYHRDRNLSSHTYDEVDAQKVFETAERFLVDAKRLLAELETRLGSS